MSSARRARYDASALRRPSDTGLLRQRVDEFRSRAVFAGAHRACAGSSSARAASRGTSSARPMNVSPGSMFKIQANMDPRHCGIASRSSACTLGRFTKDMVLLQQPKWPKPLRASRAYKFFGHATAKRSTSPTPATSFSGLVNPGHFRDWRYLCMVFQEAPLRFPDPCRGFPRSISGARPPAGHALQAIR